MLRRPKTFTIPISEEHLRELRARARRRKPTTNRDVARWLLSEIERLAARMPNRPMFGPVRARQRAPRGH